MSTCTATDDQGRRCGLDAGHEHGGQTIHAIVVAAKPDHITPGFGYLWPTPRPPRQLTLDHQEARP